MTGSLVVIAYSGITQVRCEGAVPVDSHRLISVYIIFLYAITQ